MSTKLTIKSSDLYKAFEGLSFLSSKDADYLPVGIDVSNYKLSVTCLQGCAVKSTVPVNEDIIVKTVIAYYNILNMIPSDDIITLEFDDFGLSVTGSTFTCHFRQAYSDIIELDFEKYKYTPITNTGYQETLKTVLGMNFEKLYGQSLPYIFYGEVALLKYPCAIVQCRTFGLPFELTLDTNHVKSMMRLHPQAFSTDVTGSLILKNGSTYFQIPSAQNISENTFLKMLDGMAVACKISIGDYADRLNTLMKMANRADCTVSIYANGIRTSVAFGEASSAVLLGNCNTEVLKSFGFPLQIWYAYIKAFNNSTIELLIGGDKLCLRNQAIAMLTRVLY